eukprot:4727229-Lingulodinium_polyedra.AAC.1
MLAEGAEPAASSLSGRGRRRAHAHGLSQGPIVIHLKVGGIERLFFHGRCLLRQLSGVGAGAT